MVRRMRSAQWAGCADGDAGPARPYGPCRRTGTAGCGAVQGCAGMADSAGTTLLARLRAADADRPAIAGIWRALSPSPPHTAWSQAGAMGAWGRAGNDLATGVAQGLAMVSRPRQPRYRCEGIRPVREARGAEAARRPGLRYGPLQTDAGLPPEDGVVPPPG